MQIQIKASAEQKAILFLKNIDASIKILWFENEIVDADAYIDLEVENESLAFQFINNKPVIVNSVITLCKNLPNNYCRINAWNTFLDKEKIEASTLNENLKSIFQKILWAIGFKVFFVTDIVGLISLRAIAMIINEAYFGLMDEISTKQEIDIAMKLGTNYPYGPFEWGEKIGLKNIEKLLIELAKTDTRYIPCELLLQEAQTFN